LVFNELMDSERKKFYLKTLGCKVNQCDTQSLREELERRGCLETQDPREAHLSIVNTCCVTHQADRKSRQAIRQAARLKKEGAYLAVVGCYPGYDAARVTDIPDVDAAFSVSQRQEFWQWVDRRVDGQARPDNVLCRFSGRTRAFLKIQEGCDNSCRYCVVPLVRGPSRSVPFEEAVDRGRRLVEAGHAEIVLTGINLGSYRSPGKGREGLVAVIDTLAKLKGLARLRLSSLEAADVTDDLIERMVAPSKLCPHVHIPFQSGDDAVLKHMGKRLLVADYLRLVDRLRRRVPDIAITCDMIVGYPAETDRAFKNSCRFLGQVEPLKTHLFTFSPRRRTGLEKMGARVLDPRLIRERRTEMEEVAQKLAQRFKTRFLGKSVEVLIEERRGTRWFGYSGHYLRVGLKSHFCEIGSIIQAQIEDFKAGEAIAHILI